jgi:hypothetical protein
MSQLDTYAEGLDIDEFAQEFRNLAQLWRDTWPAGIPPFPFAIDPYNTSSDPTNPPVERKAFGALAKYVGTTLAIIHARSGGNYALEFLCHTVMEYFKEHRIQGTDWATVFSWHAIQAMNDALAGKDLNDNSEVALLVASASSEITGNSAEIAGLTFGVRGIVADSLSS